MLTFFSAQQRNALSLATLQELKNQFDKIHKDTAIRVVILKAEGPVFRYAEYFLSHLRAYAKSSVLDTTSKK